MRQGTALLTPVRQLRHPVRSLSQPQLFSPAIFFAPAMLWLRRQHRVLCPVGQGLATSPKTTQLFFPLFFVFFFFKSYSSNSQSSFRAQSFAGNPLSSVTFPECAACLEHQIISLPGTGLPGNWVRGEEKRSELYLLRFSYFCLKRKEIAFKSNFR